MSRMVTVRRFAVRLALLLTAVLLPAGAFAQTPHAALLQAYSQSVAYLQTQLQTSNRTAAIDASVTVVAVHKALTQAIDIDVARVQAASRRVALDETLLLQQVEDARAERLAHIIYTGNWIGDGNPDARLDAIATSANALTLTQLALATLGPILQQMQGVALPPALLLDVTTSRDGSGAFVLLAAFRNVGGEAAQGLTLTLETGETTGNLLQEVPVGSLAAGSATQYVFSVALPPGQTIGSASVTVTATNAMAVTANIDLEAN